MSPDEPQRLTSDEYKQVFRRHAAGVAVVTFIDAASGLPVGFTATSVISVSASPPIFAFAIASTSASWSALAQAETVVVNFLGSEQAEVSVRFAARGVDRFAPGEHRLLDSGEPVLTGSLTWVRGRVLDRIPTGDSYLVTLEALVAEGLRPGAPLIYHDRGYHRIGRPDEPQAR